MGTTFHGIQRAICALLSFFLALGCTPAAKQIETKDNSVIAKPEVAPAPKQPILIQRDGKDPWGYPRSYVNAPELRRLLKRQSFSELTADFEQFQREFEQDPFNELWLMRAAEAFDSAEPDLLPLLDTWAKMRPDSFAPYLARGTYFTALAWQKRGQRYVAQTPPENFQAMRDAAPSAVKDLQHALELAPRLIAADRVLIYLALPIGDQTLADSALAHAMQVCPGCLFVRSKYLTGLQPRWGGSFAAMETFAKEQYNRSNPKLQLLIGYVEAERARVARQARRFDEALAHANAACALGDHWDFFAERAWVYWMMKDFKRALADSNRAVDLAPDAYYLVIQRARIRAQLLDTEGSAADLAQGLRIDALDDDALELRKHLLGKLILDSEQAYGAGRYEDAVRMLELAEQLDPFNGRILAAKGKAVRGNLTGSPEEIASLEAEVKTNPHDFRAHQRLDYMLGREYDRVISMWTNYIAENPDDGRAYFERSGTNFNSGHQQEANADVERACAMGVIPACAYPTPSAPH